MSRLTDEQVKAFLGNETMVAPNPAQPQYMGVRVRDLATEALERGKDIEARDAEIERLTRERDELDERGEFLNRMRMDAEGDLAEERAHRLHTMEALSAVERREAQLREPAAEVCNISLLLAEGFTTPDVLFKACDKLATALAATEPPEPEVRGA